MEQIYKCPKCGEKENLHFNYDLTQQHRPVLDVLCNMCGEFFDGNMPVAELIVKNKIKKLTEEEWVALNNTVPPKQEYPELEGTLAICNEIINKGEMNKGKLFKTGWDNWLLKVNGVSYPIHEQHSFWLTIWGEEGMELNFERQGSEVILKANGPDTHEYTQD